MIGCMVEMLVSHCLVATYNPRTPAVRLDACILLAIASTTHYICDVMHCGGLDVSG